MLLCEIMHHSIETTAHQPSGLSRECNISTVLHVHFDFSPTPPSKPHCYNPHRYGPIVYVYLEDLHKHVVIVIFSAVESIIVSIAEKMLWPVVKLLGYIFSWQKIVDDIYLIKITEIMRNTDP